MFRILQMHEQFGMTCHDVDFSAKEKEFRYTAMLEEIVEYRDADLPEDELDALVDLVVFALGTVERMGWADVYEEAFTRVMAANMQKQVGTNKKRGDFHIDLIKPDGWEAPDLKDLV